MAKITFVTAEITVQVAVIISSVTKITFAVAQITFGVAVITFKVAVLISSEAKITFVVAEKRVKWL